MAVPDPWITSERLSAVPRVSRPALARLLSDAPLSRRQRTMIATLVAVVGQLDLETVSPALAVAYRETISALAE